MILPLLLWAGGGYGNQHAFAFSSRSFSMYRIPAYLVGWALLGGLLLYAQALDPVEVEGQPLASNVTRLLQALETLGHPLPAERIEKITEAAKKQDAKA